MNPADQPQPPTREDGAMLAAFDAWSAEHGAHTHARLSIFDAGWHARAREAERLERELAWSEHCRQCDQCDRIRLGGPPCPIGRMLRSALEAPDHA